MDKKTLSYFEAGLRSAAIEGWRPSQKMQNLIEKVRAGEINIDQFKEIVLAKYKNSTGK